MKRIFSILWLSWVLAANFPVFASDSAGFPSSFSGLVNRLAGVSGEKYVQFPSPEHNQENSVTEKNETSGFAGGIGTPDDPYKVATAEQLELVRNFRGSCFIQMADIDLGVSPWNQGKGWQPVGTSKSSPFTGSFRGNGFKILNLTMNRPDSSYTGLFGRCAGAVLSGIILRNVQITGKNYTGALAGEVNGGEVMASEVTGIVSSTGDYTGGICGMITGGIIRQSSSSAVVTGHRWTGGIAGYGSAEKCLASGKVTGVSSWENESFATGGLLGEGSALSSHATGEVKGVHQVGGLIGTGTAMGCSASGNVTATGDYAGGLIGDFTTSEEEDGQEYRAGTEAKEDTNLIIKVVTSVSGQPTEIILGDGTRAKIAAFSSPMEISLSRKPYDIDPATAFPPASGFRSTGSMRTLTVRGTGEPPLVKPIVTIPASEAGSINSETVNAVRVGSLFVNGELVKEHTAILPVFLDNNGNYKFTDALFPDGIVADSTKSAYMKTAGITAKAGDQVSETKWIGNVRYYLMSFDKALNWSKRPLLERMVPDSTLAEDSFRKPWRRVSPKEREKVMRQPVCNVIIMVHGHNEEEKDGYLGARTTAPWEFTYKRLVWDLLYENISKNKEKDLPAGCTATYEFIFPTYRPIYSPVSDKTRFTYTTLGEDLGRLINEEMEGNPQLKAMLDNDMPFNLFLVAHSQGGVVARAGLRFVKPKILEKLKLVVSWGSPHTGAGLYSLRYALAVGHDMVIDGYRFPLQNIGQSEAYQSGVSGIAIDAPGIRDIRWDVSKKEMLRMGELFVENTATLNEFPDTELPYGRMFFSDNLRIFNEEEGSFMGDLLRGKYKFYEATTNHIAPLELSFDLWNLKRLYYFGKNATGIEKGAMLNKLVMKDQWNASDGAVPTYSQRAEGVWSGGNIQRRSIDLVDHEEFYGAEDPQRDDHTISKGHEVARFTFTDMELPTEPKSCPKLDLNSSEKNDSLFIEGKLIYPLYAKNYGGDDLPGKRMLRIEAVRDHPDSSLVPAIVFKFEEDGTFEGKGKKAEIPDDTLFVVATLKDASRVAGKVERKLENKVHNETKNIWYTAVQKAVDEAENGNILTVYPGIYKEYVRIVQKNLIIRSAKGPEVTIVDGEDKGGTAFQAINAEVDISGFTLRKFDYGVYLWNTASDGTFLSPRISGNVIIDNDSRGIYLTGCFSAVIRGNVLNNTGYYGIDLDKYTSKKGGEPVRIENNVISGTDRGVRVDGEAWAAFSGNIIRNNEYGAEILGKSTVQFNGDTLENNNDNGIRIFLAQNPVTITNCTVRNNTWSGIESTTNYGHHIVTGCTITGNSTGITFTHYTTGDSRATITNNLVSGNKRGIYVSVAGCTITGNTITGNTEEGGIHVLSPGEISGNTISENVSGMGGGIYVHTGNVTIKKNTITGNRATTYGGGIMTQSGVNAVIQENTISGNQSGEDGGGMYINSAQTTRPSVTGNTFSSNYAAKKGGAIYGLASGWAATEVVTVAGKPETVPRYVPCFTETTNTYTGNTHGQKFGAWGPGVDKWCQDAGYDVHP